MRLTLANGAEEVLIDLIYLRVDQSIESEPLLNVRFALEIVLAILNYLACSLLDKVRVVGRCNGVLLVVAQSWLLLLGSEIVLQSIHTHVLINVLVNHPMLFYSLPALLRSINF